MAGRARVAVALEGRLRPGMMGREGAAAEATAAGLTATVVQGAPATFLMSAQGGERERVVSETSRELET